MMHHITHIQNLDSILSEKYLYSRNILKQKNYSFEDTADQSIIKGRECNRHMKDFNDYVPFHLDFIQKNWGIGYNYVEIEKYGKKSLVYLIFAIPTENVIYSLFHPLSIYSRILKDKEIFIEDLKKELKYLPKRADKKPDFSIDKVQQFFKTEILVKDKIGVEQIREIYVYDGDVKEKVKSILSKHNIKTPVIVNTSFF